MAERRVRAVVAQEDHLEKERPPVGDRVGLQ
jgi:hypothetical protein